MRSMLALLVAATIAIGFAACGGEKPADKGTGTPPASTQPEKPAAPADDGCGDGCGCGCGCGCGEAAESGCEEGAEGCTEEPSEEAPDVKAQALDLLDRAAKAIAGEKYDEAKGYLAQLQAMKSELPPDMQKKVDELGVTLAAKAGMGGVKLPGGK